MKARSLRERIGRALVALFAAGTIVFASSYAAKEKRIVSVTLDPHTDPISMHWKNGQGHVIGNIGALNKLLAAEQRTVSFAMNGGMFEPDRSPKGLYVENGKTMVLLDTTQGGLGNFYLAPNGVFGITYQDEAFVCATSDYSNEQRVRFATQSGPMLVVKGKVNKQFTRGSKNLNIRNGVGVRPDGKVVFAISKEQVNFHDFASYFLDQGCTDALYLDGFVSRAYMPGQGIEQLDGDLGVLIAVAPLTSAPKY